ncbi:MAG: hypothetical protein FD168_2404 [Desulfobulbaceae bacterium]|nr:MAG: hypothetical protein FD168_2404 [Desulfobulbaceae bacterium]
MGFVLSLHDGAGRDVRIGFHPVPALSLGLVEGGVGILEEVFIRVQRLVRGRCYPKAQGDELQGEGLFMGNLEFDDIESDALGHMDGPFIGGIGEDHDELFPSVAGTEISGTDQGIFDGLGHLLQTFIPTVMAIGIVVRLEMIDIAHDDRQ